MKKDKSKKKSVVVVDKAPTKALVVQQDPHMNLIQMAIQKGSGVADLEKIMDLQERWENNNARKSFYAALSNFQSQIPVITKNGFASFPHKSGNGRTEYSYAKLEDITEAIKPFLVENGLSYRYEQTSGEKQLITVACIVTHADGHSERTEMSAYGDQTGSKNNIQQMASTVSYLRRYTLTGALGITVSEEDNDGADSPEQQIEYFNQEKFENLLQGWKEAVSSGKKTPDRILEYMKAKNANLSPTQIESIQLLGK
ncbi:MAG: ERF family protein [Nitrosomonadaceae bacterium]